MRMEHNPSGLECPALRRYTVARAGVSFRSVETSDFALAVSRVSIRIVPPGNP
jgi:hypothetical protein